MVAEWRQVTHAMKMKSRVEDGKAQQVDMMAHVNPLLAGEILIV
jgi:hypothetical protein